MDRPLQIKNLLRHLQGQTLQLKEDQELLKRASDDLNMMSDKGCNNFSLPSMSKTKCGNADTDYLCDASINNDDDDVQNAGPIFDLQNKVMQNNSSVNDALSHEIQEWLQTVRIAMLENGIVEQPLSSIDFSNHSSHTNKAGIVPNINMKFGFETQVPHTGTGPPNANVDSTSKANNSDASKKRGISKGKICAGQLDWENFAGEARDVCVKLATAETELSVYADVSWETYCSLTTKSGAAPKESLWRAMSALEFATDWLSLTLIRVHHHPLKQPGNRDTNGNDSPWHSESSNGDNIPSFTCLAHIATLCHRMMCLISIIWKLEQACNLRLLRDIDEDGVKREKLISNILYSVGYDVPERPEGSDEFDYEYQSLWGGDQWRTFQLKYRDRLPHLVLLAVGLRCARLEAHIMNIRAHFSLLTRDTFCRIPYGLEYAKNSDYYNHAKSESSAEAGAENADVGRESKGVQYTNPYEDFQKTQLESLQDLYKYVKDLVIVAAARSKSIIKAASRQFTEENMGSGTDSDGDLLREIHDEVGEEGALNVEAANDVKEVFNACGSDEGWNLYKDPILAVSSILSDLKGWAMASEALLMSHHSPLIPTLSFRSGYRLVLSDVTVRHNKSSYDDDESVDLNPHAVDAAIDEILREYPPRKAADGPYSFDAIRDLDCTKSVKLIMETVKMRNKFEYYEYAGVLQPNQSYSTNTNTANVTILRAERVLEVATDLGQFMHITRKSQTMELVAKDNLSFAESHPHMHLLHTPPPCGVDLSNCYEKQPLSPYVYAHLCLGAATLVESIDSCQNEYGNNGVQ